MVRAFAGIADLARPRPNEDEVGAAGVDAVVVGCDANSANDVVLRAAAAEARRRDARLLVVIAFAEPVDPDIDDFDTPPQVRRDNARNLAQKAMERSVPDPPPHRVVAIAGLPGRVLAAKFPDAQLFVIGARHKHLLGPLTSIESTEHILRKRSNVPIIVVPLDSESTSSDS